MAWVQGRADRGKPMLAQVAQLVDGILPGIRLIRPGFAEICPLIGQITRDAEFS
jgi:hypothetical protein